MISKYRKKIFGILSHQGNENRNSIHPVRMLITKKTANAGRYEGVTPYTLVIGIETGQLLQKSVWKSLKQSKNKMTVI